MPPPTDSRRRLTAWLGLLAIWLLVLMPLASQMAEAAVARQPDATICTAAQHPGHRAPAGNALSACGYCDLLAAHSYAPPAPAPAALPLHPLVRRAARPLPAPAPRSFTTLAASARAPPPSA
ncbi:DUF2946 family protein [Burkholderia plantarii]|uniref:DUF2946 family protein n=1 Tax=Burkholderia plantarii TaxID=41899 RepID=UPI000870A478|nr:DUF2946 family protein [Burkholderia plantarii]